MWRLITLTTATILSLSSQASSSSIPPRVASIRSRNLVTDGSISDSYDFIIVGGGTAGLILGARLSEDSDTTVLVLEAGHSGDDVAGTINVPDNTYYNSLTKSEYDWAYSTAPQTNMNDHELVWPRGKVLGGSSAINGMYAVRPPQVEVEAWQSLIASEDGADEWSWDSFNAAMIKSETFTPPTAETQELAGITFDESFHGDDGPMHSSYPGYQLTFNGQWTPTLNSIGIESRQDGFGGENWGASISASYINPTNWTRSYSRSGYLDPLPPRSNLDVLADATVTRIVFEKNDGGDLVATGVEYAANADAPRTTVSVKKEVVLAAGVVGSPQVLLLSGVGPSDVLESVGIEVQNALPGVGQHLQDHLVAPIYWSTDVETAGDLQASGLNTPEFLSYINSATAYVNLTAIMGAGAKEELVQSLADAADASASLVPSQSSEVIEGYKAMYAKSVELLRDTPVGSIELLLALTGAGAVGIQAGLQHPLSPGHIYLKSNNPFEYPVIDPGYLGHTGDLTILREGMKLARIAGNTPPLSDLLTGEMSPGPDVETDEQWEEWLKSNAHTEYHPRGSCSMLPLAHGGVINAKLQVYGTTNVRVADSSIFPIDMSCHLQAPTIGVAEKAAEIIRAQYSSNGSGSGSGSGSSGGSSGNGSSDDDDSDAAMSLHTASVTLLGAWLAVALLL